MLAAVYLAAIAVPLLLAVVALGLWIARFVAEWIDGAPAAAPAAEVAALRRAAPPAAQPHAIVSGPLQLVDRAEPSSKLCPDCAETVLGSARVCKHCHFRFEPPVRGSWAV
jgi:hypothetical protein